MENKHQIDQHNEDIIDLEEYAKSGKVPPRGKKYRIKVDTITYIIHKEIISGREILEVAKKIPVERFQLNQKLHGGIVKKVGYDENVDLAHPGIERFMTLPLDQTEG